MVDSSIIALVKQKNNTAFKSLYQTSIGYVYAIVRRYVDNNSEHKDIIQEIYARVFLSIHTYDSSKGDFKFWIRRVTINQCLQHYRKNKSPMLFVPLDYASELKSADTQLLDSLSKADIEKYLQDMPVGYRQVFMLVIIDEYSHKEVGELLGISAETSRSQLSRAKNWLRKKTINNKTFLASGF